MPVSPVIYRDNLLCPSAALKLLDLETRVQIISSTNQLDTLEKSPVKRWLFDSSLSTWLWERNQFRKDVLVETNEISNRVHC